MTVALGTFIDSNYILVSHDVIYHFIDRNRNDFLVNAPPSD